jgi:hypothetical protein
MSFLDTLTEIPIYPVTSDLTARGTVAICILLSIFAWISIGLRYYTRRYIVNNLGWDDHIGLLATILLTVFCALICAEYEKGKGKSVIDRNTMAFLSNVLLAIETLYIVTVGVFKISLALFFLRVVISRAIRLSIICIISFISLFGLAYSLFAIFKCGVPHGSTFWIKKVENQCASQSSSIGLAYFHGVLMSSTDLYFLVLVYPIVVPTRMKLREKVNIAVLMSIGTL